MNYGFITVASAIPSVRVADVDYNIEQIEKLVAQADEKGVEIMVFPELSVTGYTCQDLFAQQSLVEGAENAVLHLLDVSRKLDVITIIGVPVCIGTGLYNCAVVCQHGTVLGIVPKRFLPNYSEFYEQRWFVSGDDMTEPVEIRYAGNKVTVLPGNHIFQTSDEIGRAHV